jgi:hypothetical protein
MINLSRNARQYIFYLCILVALYLTIHAYIITPFIKSTHAELFFIVNSIEASILFGLVTLLGYWHVKSTRKSGWSLFFIWPLYIVERGRQYVLLVGESDILLRVFTNNLLTLSVILLFSIHVLHMISEIKAR